MTHTNYPKEGQYLEIIKEVTCWGISGQDKDFRIVVPLREYGNSLISQNEVFQTINWIQTMLSIKLDYEPSYFKHDLLPQLSQMINENEDRDKPSEKGEKR